MNAPSEPPSPELAGRVTAIVVTYNRRDLLRECLQALLAQTRLVDTILVVNNVSTDGTAEMLTTEFARLPAVRVLNLPKNVGGAGGFHAGMECAFADGADWMWLLDDDTIAAPDALEQMLAARARFPAEPPTDAPHTRQPDLLASKVRWTDGDLHPMNVPWGKLGDPPSAFLAAGLGAYSLRTATFVSCLIHRRHVERYGLPIADYFIWGDDVEYTGRILRENLGVLVPASVVCHKTAKKYGTVDAHNPRFYYYVRNTLWMLARSPAWTRKERVRMSLAFLTSIGAYLRVSRGSLASFQAIGRGLRDSVLMRPEK